MWLLCESCCCWLLYCFILSSTAGVRCRINLWPFITVKKGGLRMKLRRAINCVRMDIRRERISRRQSRFDVMWPSREGCSFVVVKSSVGANKIVLYSWYANACLFSPLLFLGNANYFGLLEHCSNEQNLGLSHLCLLRGATHFGLLLIYY